VDFNGAQVSIRDLNQRYGVRVTPTLVFVNSQGEKVTQSLVGLLTEDFYGAYLAQNISEGVASLPPLSN
jgi:thioredoxin-related protein